MARFDIYLMPNKKAGYILDVQADILSGLATRTVVPLVQYKSIEIKTITRLNPIFIIEEKSYVMLTQSIATIPLRLLKNPIGSLDYAHTEIINALDLLLIGF